MSPSHRNGQEELEKTLPFTVEEISPSPRAPVERYSGHNMSLVVGTRSNPGIKRQHKPNEDSLFAAQGERTLNSQAQQFGLFVVADGMGGHANGRIATAWLFKPLAKPSCQSCRATNRWAMMPLSNCCWMACKVPTWQYISAIWSTGPIWAPP